MNAYEMAKKNYDRGLWTVEMVKALVKNALITAEQFEEITSEKFVE